MSSVGCGASLLIRFEGYPVRASELKFRSHTEIKNKKIKTLDEITLHETNHNK